MNLIIISAKVKTTKAKLRSIKAFTVETTTNSSDDCLNSAGVRKYLRKNGIKVH